MFVAAFGLNFLWEMLQMPAYAELAGRSWRQTGLTCALASVGDAAITLSIYVVVALATRNWRWGTQGARKNYIVVAVLAATCAILMELVALATRRWSYLNRMPAVPILGIGLWPLLQLPILVPLAIWIAAWLPGRSRPKAWQ